MSQRAITRNQAAAADTNDAANLATITTTTIADAATATAGTSTAAPVKITPRPSLTSSVKLSLTN